MWNVVVFDTESFYDWVLDKYPPPADDQNEVEA